MGKVVATVFTTHVPRLMITDPIARRAYMGRNVTTFYDAMPKLERERLRHLDFDTFLLIDTALVLDSGLRAQCSRAPVGCVHI